MDTPDQLRQDAGRITAAIYCRVNGAPAPGALDGQEAHCQAYAAAKGYRVDKIHVYRDLASGAARSERLGLAQLQEGIRRGEFQLIVVTGLDRLSCDPGQLMGLLREATDHGLSVEVANAGPDAPPRTRGVEGEVPLGIFELLLWGAGGAPPRVGDTRRGGADVLRMEIREF